jgi:isoleucyl-tRNA synthetase
MFKSVNPKEDFIQLEHKILDFWEKDKTFKKLQKKNQGKKTWSFLDGPITANNPMGVHHAWGRTIKDTFQRYKAMQGFDERYQNGFDCQGLWVEVEVEKDLDFKSKKDIEKYGVDKFVKKCKARVLKYSKIQTEQSIRLGQWMDWDNSYYTMSDVNNYTIWHFLKKCNEKGYLYKGRDSVPWCPRCSTAISQHEILSEEYKKITHEAVYFKLPVLSGDLKGAYFLVWTTTPWTIPANVALAVNPEFKYGLYKNEEESLILLKDLADKVLEGDYKLEKEFLGKDLLGLNYKGSFDGLERVKEAREENPETFHTVIDAEDLVTAEEGTGIVHIAPGAGAEDFKLSKEKKLSVIAVINDEAVYLDKMAEFSGKNAKENPSMIFDYLKELNKGEFFYKTEQYTHRYPTCWRCKEELVWRVVNEWYISMDELRYKMMDVAKKIEWIPSFGLDRELDWLKNMSDWMISKKRYWGLALPIYECSCGHFEVIGSKEELKEKAVEGFDKFEGNSPHKPWIDEVKVKCSKCGKKISRIPDVGNPWLDAGIVPFSTMKYFEDHKYWEKWFPADFITECFPGQFKNWFYSLIAMSTVLEDTNPYKTLLGHSSVRDDKGEEMHKSKGNAIWFDDAAEKMGVDVMRWMYCAQNPEFNLRFGFKSADEAKKRVVTLWNTYYFFVMYANIDKVDGKQLGDSELKLNNLLDQWIISSLQELIIKSEKHLDNYEVYRVMADVEKFIDNLSNWYVRRSRRRFWKSENDQDKDEAYKTLHTCLVDLMKIISPMIPFLTEEIYKNLTDKDSIHLEDWPKADKKLINEKLNEEMNRTREISTLGLSLRAENSIKVRQPLSELMIKGNELAGELVDILKDEINVKKITFAEKLPEGENWKVAEDIALDIELTEELEKEGLTREVVRRIQQLRKKAGYEVDDHIVAKISGVDLGEYGDYVKKEVLAEEIIEDGDVDLEKEFEINGVKVKLGVKK